MKTGKGHRPPEPGEYAVYIWYGWRVLEWADGKWWHNGRVAPWPAPELIEVWAGPLPTPADPEAEYDL